MKSAGKVYKGGIVQIVSLPNSSSTFWKSCTTFGRRNYLLRLSQILHDDRHFLFQETVAILVITQSVQLFHQWTAAKHPPVQILQGSGTPGMWAVQQCQVHLRISFDSEIFHTTKILKNAHITY